MLLVSNIIFAAVYLKAWPSFTAWLVAFRYACATAAPGLLISALVFIASGRWQFGRRLALWLAGLVIFYCSTILVGDLVYYGQAGKHSTIEFLLYYQNFMQINAMVMRDYVYIPVVYLAIGIIFFWRWKRFAHRDKFLPALSRRAILRRILLGLVTILLSIIAFRGGLQGRPLRPADAFVSLSLAEGDFALNGIYTSFYALFHRSSFPVADDPRSLSLARDFILAPGEKTVADGFPFLRRTNPAGVMVRKNVIFIILESWSARRVGAFGDKTGATPFFDSLATRGWLLTNAYATGRRSIASLPSAISSIPTLFGSLYITSPHEQNFQRGLGALFAEVGYSTAFTYASKPGSMGFNAYARLAGFDTITTRADFPSEAPGDGVWGVYDHVMFAKTLTELRNRKQPSLTVLYTLHPHPPFKIPDNAYRFPTGTPRADYYNALRYADDSLRDFFTSAQREPWFDNTVFVFMADHAFEEEPGSDSFRIPLLFYAPGFVAAKVDEAIASELDVVPTLIDLLKVQATHASMGHSLLEPNRRAAYLDLDHSAGIMRNVSGKDLLLIFGSEGFKGYYDLASDPQWTKLIPSAPLPQQDIQAMQAYIGVMGYAIAKNRIARPPAAATPRGVNFP
jgi:phosphoglycerol transferase MdoB-like AlkP superfamily enzyme